MSGDLGPFLMANVVPSELVVDLFLLAIVLGAWLGGGGWRR